MISLSLPMNEKNTKFRTEYFKNIVGNRNQLKLAENKNQWKSAIYTLKITINYYRRKFIITSENGPRLSARESLSNHSFSRNDSFLNKFAHAAPVRGQTTKNRENRLIPNPPENGKKVGRDVSAKRLCQFVSLINLQISGG